MADVNEKVQEQEATKAVETNTLAQNVWDDNPIVKEAVKADDVDTKGAASTTTQATAAPSTKDVEEEIVDANEYLKNNLGFDDWDKAKQELQELRALKEKQSVPDEIKFANDDSKRVFESLKEGKEDDVYEILTLKRQLSKAEKLDITDAKQAAELIRLNYQLKHKDLEAYEISDLFNEQYEKPAKPDKDITMDDSEYQELLGKWQVRCDAIDRKIVRDAKMAKPELLQMRKELVYPEIPKKEEVKESPQPTQEQVEAALKFKNSFLKSTQESINSFNGFSAQVKDKDVDYTVNYVPSNEEKAEIENSLKSFAENGFNSNALLAERWVNEDGTINTKIVAEDLALLKNKEKVFQKIANDAANQRMDLYLKGKKNISIKPGSSPEATFAPQDTKSEQEKMADWAFGIF